VCQSGQCACADQTVVDRCRSEACAQCEVFDSGTMTCEAAPQVPGECRCSTSGGTSCTPGGPNVCPLGERCSEDYCTCIDLHACGGIFGPNGDFAANNCDAALGCCASWLADAQTCAARTQTTCAQDNACVWAGQSSTCISAASPTPCCNTGETATCVSDPENPGVLSVACQNAPCSVCPGATCDKTCTGLSQTACTTAPHNTACAWTGSGASAKCVASACASWQTCAGTTANPGGECGPACQPQVEFCSMNAQTQTCGCQANAP
jgi:hypothetical protein